MSKIGDGFVSVVHAHDDATAILEFKNCVLLGTSSFGSVHQFHLQDKSNAILGPRLKIEHYFSEQLNYRAIAGNDQICGFVLVTVGVTANANGIGPTRDQTRNCLTQNRFTEHGSAQDVSNGAVG